MGLLAVQDLCFWAVWAAGPVHKIKLGADYEQLLRVVFRVNVLSALKSCIINYLILSYNFVTNFFGIKLFFLGLRTFSNVNVLHKGLLLQDWVFDIC